MKKIIILLMELLLINSIICVAQKKESLEMVFQRAHSKKASCIDFTPDGKYFVSGTENGDIKFWYQNGVLIRTILPPRQENDKYEINSIAISPDGQRIATMLGDKHILVFKLDGTLVANVYHEYSKHYELKYSSDSKTLVGFNDAYVLFMDSEANPIDTVKLVKQPGDTRDNMCWAMFPYKPDKMVIVIKKWQWFGPQVLPSEMFLNVYNVKTRSEVNSYKIDLKPNTSFAPSSFNGHFCAGQISVPVQDPPAKSEAMIINVDEGTYHLVPVSAGAASITIDEEGTIIREHKAPDFELGDPLSNGYAKKFPDEKRSVYCGDNVMKVYDYMGNYLYDCGTSIADKQVSYISGDGKSVSVIDKMEKTALNDYIRKREFIKCWDFNNLSLHEYPGLRPSTERSIIALNPRYTEPSTIQYAYLTGNGYQFEFSTVNGNGQIVYKNPNALNFSFDYINWNDILNFSPNGTYLVSKVESALKTFDLQGNLIKEQDLTERWKANYVDTRINFTKDGNSFLTLSNKGIIVWNRECKSILSITPKKLEKMGYNIDYIRAATISPDGSTLVFTYKNTMVFVNSEGEQIKVVPTPKLVSSFMNIKYSPDGEYIVGVYNSTDILFIKPDGTEVKRLQGHDGAIKDFSFSQDGKYMVSTSTDQTVRFWNLTTNDQVILLSDDSDWIMFTPDGYYDASRNGGKFVGMTFGINSFGIDQFAAKYNRPDILLKRMGMGSSELIAHFENQHKKRLRRMGLTEEQLAGDFHIPTATIKSTEIKDKQAALRVTLSDDRFNLKRYNIFVNDVPIYGAYGKEISGNNIDINENIELTYGNNKIEISCTNEKGAESYRALTYANYNKQTFGNLYFLAFGVSKYSNPALNLQYAEKDAKDLEKVLKSLKHLPYEQVYTKVLTNEQVTPEAIKEAKSFVAKAKPDDTFILFIAGHGMHDNDAEATYYYLTSNVDINNLKGTAANFETIEDLLQGIPPRNKLFLMDACESGELDDEDYKALTDSQILSGLGIASRGFKTTASQSTINNQQSTKRTYLYQKDRYIYNDLARRSGAIVFSSSRGGELSYERSDIENGLFTEYIMKAFTTDEGDKNKNGVISTDELRDYVSTQVAKASNEFQHPVVDRDNIYQRFEFGLNTSGEYAELDSTSVKRLIDFEMVPVAGGTFDMGDNGNWSIDAKPFHKVAVSDFLMGKYEVTQAQWRAIMGNNPSLNKGCDSCPVENVSWNEVQAFIGKLNNLTGKNYRLPTEAEWEYAAFEGNLNGRARGLSSVSGSADYNDQSNFAWFGQSKETNTHPVGQKGANKLGLYDMSGNVSEYCNDWYGETYYSVSPTDNPQGPATGNKKVIRGGCIYSTYLSIIDRESAKPEDKKEPYESQLNGFRLALSPQNK